MTGESQHLTHHQLQSYRHFSILPSSWGRKQEQEETDAGITTSSSDDDSGALQIAETPVEEIISIAEVAEMTI
jgi:hypothetical protein